MTANPLHDPAERLAAEELGLEPTATRADVRAAFLTRLARENFVPSPKTLAAVNILGGESLPLPMPAQQACDDFEAADLNQFLNEFWTLLPEERYERWQWLKETENSYPVQNELDRIALAVPMKVTHFESESENEIAALLRSLFLMPARARAIKRTEWLSEHAGKDNYRAAARNVESLAHLDPLLFDALGNPSLKRYAVKGISDADREKYAIRDARPKGFEYLFCKCQNAINRVRYYLEVDDKILVVVSAVAGIVLFLVFGDRSPRRYPPPPVTQSPTQNESLEQVARDTKKFLDNLTREQKRQLESYDPKSGKPAPDGYSLWRLAGGKSKTQSNERKP